MKADNKYTKMQKHFYESTADNMVKQDHRQHDENPDYWDILLGPVKRDSEKWKGKMALDFGCGTGRNISNLFKLAEWFRVDGVDIARNNLLHARNLLGKEDINFNLYENNGVDLARIFDNTYSFVMSTIVLQHIAVYDIRFSLLKEIYRVMVRGGLFSFQMGYGEGRGRAEYHENAYEAKGTNSEYDVIVNNPSDVVNDLQKIGFTDITYEITPPFDDGHKNWIFFKAIKL